jgi:hypothetical protein
LLFDGGRDEGGSLVKSTESVLQESQKMEGLGMSGRHLERETIGSFGFREPASLMMSLPLLEKGAYGSCIRRLPGHCLLCFMTSTVHTVHSVTL